MQLPFCSCPSAERKKWYWNKHKIDTVNISKVITKNSFIKNEVINSHQPTANACWQQNNAHCELQPMINHPHIRISWIFFKCGKCQNSHHLLMPISYYLPICGVPKSDHYTLVTGFEIRCQKLLSNSSLYQNLAESKIQLNPRHNRNF